MAESELKSLHQNLFDEGLKVRRAVVGDTYVERSLANGSSEFARPGQELVTEWCWGHIWTRPGLERKQRSLLSKVFPSKEETRANCFRLGYVDCPQGLA